GGAPPSPAPVRRPPPRPPVSTARRSGATSGTSRGRRVPGNGTAGRTISRKPTFPTAPAAASSCSSTPAGRARPSASTITPRPTTTGSTGRSFSSTVAGADTRTGPSTASPSRSSSSPASGTTSSSTSSGTPRPAGGG